MLVSAVVCTHNPDNYPNLRETMDSLLAQTHRETEIIVVVDGSEKLYEKLSADYSSKASVKTILLEKNVGVSGARNAGIKVAKGDVIAFIDDDAVAAKEWVENLLTTYRDLDAAAAGGKILPVWLAGAPDYLPEELYWLVGITHKGFAGEKVAEVRNTFGPNMSFKREVFDKIGFFNENLGFAQKRAPSIQAEEPEFALRMRQKLGKGVIYNPKAIVYHKIPPAKVKVRALLKRAFYQGYSKALMRRLNIAADSIATERSYLRALLLHYVPSRMKRIYLLSELKKLSLLIACIISVGLGFTYAYVKSYLKSR